MASINDSTKGKFSQLFFGLLHKAPLSGVTSRHKMCNYWKISTLSQACISTSADLATIDFILLVSKRARRSLILHLDNPCSDDLYPALGIVTLSSLRYA